MKQLVLLFFRQMQGENTITTELEGEPVLKGVITTPLGTVDSIRQSQLEMKMIPYISETGGVGQLPMKKLYLDQVLDKLTIDLGVDKTDLLGSSREIVIVAEMDTSADKEYIPCYYGTTGNNDNMENLRRLEANVMRCLQEGLAILPNDLLAKWIKIVLNPIFEQARTVIAGTETN